jgi:hypothetical protein
MKTEPNSIETLLDDAEILRRSKRIAKAIALKIWIVWVGVSYLSATFVTWNPNPYYWSGLIRALFAFAVFGWGLALLTSHDKAVRNIEDRIGRRQGEGKHRSETDVSDGKSKFQQRLEEIQKRNQT